MILLTYKGPSYIGPIQLRSETFWQWHSFHDFVLTQCIWNNNSIITITTITTTIITVKRWSNLPFTFTFTLHLPLRNYSHFRQSATIFNNLLVNCMFGSFPCYFKENEADKVYWVSIWQLFDWSYQWLNPSERGGHLAEKNPT